MVESELDEVIDRSPRERVRGGPEEVVVARASFLEFWKVFVPSFGLVRFNPKVSIIKEAVGYVRSARESVIPRVSHDDEKSYYGHDREE